MAENEELKQLFFEVNEFLGGYLKIHDMINRQTKSFLGVIENIFGKGVPMSELIDHSKSLILQSESVKIRLVSFKLNSYSVLSNNEKYFFDKLFDYYTSIERTVNSLVERQILMDKRKNNPTNKTLLSELKKKEKEYKYLIKTHSTIGGQLNYSSQIVFR